MFARRNRPLRFNITPRRGTTTVETAVVLPVFLLLLFAIFEFGHAQLINNVLNSACRNAARIGAVEGSSTAQVRKKVEEMIGSVVPTSKVKIFVKNASSFDGGSSAVGAQLENLPDIELRDTEARTLFVVRAKVPYKNVSIVPMPFLKNVEIDAQAFMRHE
jgi:Flp pilus assembly protein TadG